MMTKGQLEVVFPGPSTQQQLVALPGGLLDNPGGSSQAWLGEGTIEHLMIHTSVATQPRVRIFDYTDSRGIPIEGGTIGGRARRWVLDLTGTPSAVRSNGSANAFEVYQWYAAAGTLPTGSLRRLWEGRGTAVVAGETRTYQWWPATYCQEGMIVEVDFGGNVTDANARLTVAYTPRQLGGSRQKINSIQSGVEVPLL